MKKIILLISCLLIFTGCGKEVKKVNENFEIDQKLNIYLPNNWGVKTGMYGKFYSNFDDIILIQNSYANVVKDVKTSLNFYRPDLIKLNDEIILKENNEYFSGIIDRNQKKHIILRKLEVNGETILVSIISNSQERAYEIYKEVFK